MLRHACGFKLANDGHDTRALQHYLGHKNIQHTVRYTELSPAPVPGLLEGLRLRLGLLVAATASAAARLMRAYAAQVEALRRLRNGGSQTLRVEHVHVNEGGQALIGNVSSER